jgi:hypothetical protein
MPAVDPCEPQIIRALAKAGWKVVARQILLRTAANEGVVVDLRFRHMSDQRRIMLVEVKCFRLSGLCWMSSIMRSDSTSFTGRCFGY